MHEGYGRTLVVEIDTKRTGRGVTGLVLLPSASGMSGNRRSSPRYQAGDVEVAVGSPWPANDWVGECHFERIHPCANKHICYMGGSSET